ncbi:hypothetical protein BKI52_36810 [marine bacterium AO1-C]|nr:hypothetical protein BKI52_36810 [marine bacterium AO1-C]
MKLRCTNNSLRLRVRKSDLEILQQKGSISESLTFGPQIHFRFSLKIAQDLAEVQARFENNEMSVYLPVQQAEIWINSNQVGIQTTSSATPDSEALDILIEKDFPCDDRPNEDKNDTFWELANKEGKSEIC